MLDYNNICHAKNYKAIKANSTFNLEGIGAVVPPPLMKKSLQKISYDVLNGAG